MELFNGLANFALGCSVAKITVHDCDQNYTKSKLIILRSSDFQFEYRLQKFPVCKAPRGFRQGPDSIAFDFEVLYKD